MSDSLTTLSHWERIARELAFIEGTFPVEAVFEARNHWPEVREEFLAELVLAVADPDSAIDEDNALPIYAMFLAAERRDAAFAAPVLDLLRLPVAQVDGLIGDMLTDGMGRCLGSVYQGDDSPIRALAMDESRDIYVRLAAIDALVVRVMEGDAVRDAVAEFVFTLTQQVAIALRSSPQLRPKRVQFNVYADFFNLLVSSLSELGAHQYWPAIEQWDRDGLIDLMDQNLASLREMMFASDGVRLARMHKPYYIRDTVEEISGWGCFNESEPVDTYVRAQPKVGRNDPCPCGSGKKYKKCCGANR